MTRPFPSLACCMGAADAFLHSSSPTNQQALVSFLHDLFSRFDELTGRYGVSKIETVVSPNSPLCNIGAAHCIPRAVRPYTSAHRQPPPCSSLFRGT